MKAAERILDAARELFNEQGVARVSTNAIADAAELSPGNLYYHYRNKDDILIALFRQLQRQLTPLLEPVDDIRSWAQWFDWWQSWFSKVSAYDFIFHDPHFLQHLNDHLGFHYQQMLSQLEHRQLQVFVYMKSVDELVATDRDMQRLAAEVSFIAFFWQDYLELKHRKAAHAGSVTSALQQISGLILPYLRTPQQLDIELRLQLS